VPKFTIPNYFGNYDKKRPKNVGEVRSRTIPEKPTTPQTLKPPKPDKSFG
jgi:hypothetical protein